MRKLAVVMLLAALAAVPATAQAYSFKAKLRTHGHHPTAGKHWPITVSARSYKGHKLHARACYNFFYNGQKVSSRCPTPGHPEKVSHAFYHFYGSFHDPIIWPKRAVGIPLTFQVVVFVKHHGTAHLNYSVNVRN